MKSALVITTYNSPRELSFCLESLRHQSHSEFDIFIADDGSGAETRTVVEDFRQIFRARLHHVWHEDHGYAKSEINNKVFRQLETYDLVVLIDGDTFVHPDFIRDHLQQHQEAQGQELMFMGRRVDLGPKISARLQLQNIAQFSCGMSRELLISGLKGETRNWLRALRLPWLSVRTFLKRDEVPDLLGSNFSISRSLLFRINGYNEDYQKYWGEDGDLFVRVRNSGALIRGSKSLAIQFHVFHKMREPDPKHVSEYREKLNNRDYVRCRRGIKTLDGQFGRSDTQTV